MVDETANIMISMGNKKIIYFFISHIFFLVYILQNINAKAFILKLCNSILVVYNFVDFIFVSISAIVLSAFFASFSTDSELFSFGNFAKI